MADEGDDSKQQPDQPYELIASEQTREALGWVGDRLPGIAQADVIVVARHDLVTPKDEKNPDLQAIAAKKLGQIFNEAAPELSGIPADVVNVIADKVLAYDASATGFDIDGDGKSDIGVIMAPDFNMTPAVNVAQISGLPKEAVKDNVPGTSADYNVWTMFHEARHVLQQEMHEQAESRGSTFEADADRQAIIEMEKAKADGMPVNMDVARIMQEGRLINSVAQDHYQSMVKALVDLTPGKIVAAHSTQYIVEGDKQINTILPRDNQASYPVAMKVNSMVNIAVGEFLLAESKDFIERGIKPEDSGLFTQEECKAFETNKLALSERTTELALSEPVMGYIALKSLRERGYIQEGTPEAAYADRVTSFYEKHVDLEQLDGGMYDHLREFFADVPQMVPGVQNGAENAVDPAQDKNMDTDNVKKAAPPQVGR